MSKLKRVKATKQAIKTINNELEQTLAGALADWKEKIGEKRFEKKVKKAVKVLSKGLKLVPVKKAKKVEKKISINASKKPASQAN